MSHEIGRSGTAWSVLRTSAGVGLTWGAAWGLVQALILGLAHGAGVGLKDWIDVLSGSALAHGILWGVYGLGLGVVGALGLRAARPIQPRAFAAAAFVAGASTLALWLFAEAAGLRMAHGIHGAWCLALAAFWLATFKIAHVLGRRVDASPAGESVRWWTRRALIPLLLLLIASLSARLVERPRLSESPGSWRQAWAATRAESTSSRPSVVLVVLGSERADHLGCYGYPRPTSPHLDDFAGDAVVFDQCFSAATASLPAQASMLTGLHVVEHSTHDTQRGLDAASTTLPELLGDRSYDTAAFHNGTLEGGESDLLQGFARVAYPDRFQRARYNSVAGFVEAVLYPAGLVGQRLGGFAAEDGGAELTNRLVRRWLDGRDRRQPFFLFVQYTEAEAPYRPDPAHRRPFVDPADLERSYRTDPASPAGRALASDLYDGELRVTDDRLGELLSILSSRVTIDDTLIIVTSDHGENLGDHDLWGHGQGVHDTLARVPLVVRFPRRIRPTRSPDLVQTVDILPTVLDAVAGGPVPSASTTGRSLLPAPGSLARPAPPLIIAPPGARLPEMTGRVAVTMADGPQYAIRQGPWKFVRGPSGAEWLYRTAEDPGERTDVLEQHRDVAEALAGTLDRWLASLRGAAL